MNKLDAITENDRRKIEQTKTPCGGDRGLRHWLTLFSLIFAGEMIFSLPFHVARFFRPTLLDVFQLSNADLGDTFALYGVVAMLSYFPGGMIADYFPARRLLAVSLLATAAGGLYFAQIPQGPGLALVFGYWGLSTICLFWAGMIKATRQWGNVNQGRAFGLLDGGRGLVAAVMSSLGVLMLSMFLQGELLEQDAVGKMHGLQAVIYLYTFFTFVAALLVWWFIPNDRDAESGKPPQAPLSGVSRALSSIQVWMIAGIVICAYCGFKATDNYGLYAVQVLSMSQMDAAAFTSWSAYLRPVGAISAGLLADRFGASRIIVGCFFVALFTYVGLIVQWPWAILAKVAIFNFLISYLAMFALRGIYFAVMEESKVHWQVTGTAVGIISLVGFTPDIFFASVSGRILDAAPGAQGFENFFIFTMGISAAGLLMATLLSRKIASMNKITTSLTD